MKRVWLASIVLCVACGEEQPENAYLTLSVLFAPRTAEAPYARIGFQRASDDSLIYDAVLELDDELSLQRVIAIEAAGSALQKGGLDLALERCADADCDEVHAVERLRLSRAFYRGEQTRFAWSEGSLEPSDAPHTLDACLVEGCGGYCDAQGRHVCEQ